MRIRSLVALCCVTFLAILGLTPPATAASAYDDVYRNVNSISVSGVGYGVSCPSHDISNNWMKYIEQSSYWPGTGQLLQDMATSFQAARENGSVAVSYASTTETNFSQEMVVVVWSELTGEVEFDSISVRLTSASEMYQVVIMPKRWVYGTGDCTPVVYDVQHAYGGSNSNGYQVSLAATSSTMKNFFISGTYLSYPDGYPDGYDGELVRTSFMPIMTPYTGTIDCGGVDPVAMIIEQDANDGYATLTPTTAGMADWSYSLTSSPYRAGINCGNEWIYTPYVDPVTIDEDWVCNTFSRPPYCS